MRSGYVSLSQILLTRTNQKPAKLNLNFSPTKPNFLGFFKSKMVVVQKCLSNTVKSSMSASSDSVG